MVQQKELKEVFNPNFLNKCHKKSEILANMSRLQKILGVLDQDKGRPEGLVQTALQLVTDRFLGNDDKEVRLSVCCCIVDILRLFAPNAPYSTSQLAGIFTEIGALMKLLATNGSESNVGSKLSYIIISLARVKSCVVMVELSENGHPEQMCRFFDTTIRSVRAHHDEECKHIHMSLHLRLTPTL